MMANALIRPDTSLPPKYEAIARAACSRASISLRRGVPWQYATAGIKGLLAELMASRGSITISVKPAASSSALYTAVS